VLGTQLRRLRETADISRADAGYARHPLLGIEGVAYRARPGSPLKARDISDLLTLYGIADAAERESFLEMVEQANEPGWWRRYKDVMPGWFHDFVGLEESASRIQSCELQFVPGLLQTEESARAIAARGRVGSASEEGERRIALRMRRQKILGGMHPPKLWTSPFSTGRSAAEW
jgi:hypothetical protein